MIKREIRNLDGCFSWVKSLLALLATLLLGGLDLGWCLGWSLLHLLGDDLGYELSNGVGSSFPVAHDLESLEVGESGAGLSLGELLGGWGSLPFGVEAELFDGLEESAGSGSTLDGDNELGKSKSLDWVEDSWEVNSVNEGSVLISEVDDDDDLAVVFSEVDESNSSCFNESSVWLYESYDVSFEE